MNSEIIPPSPNWYCSRATDTNTEGIFLFAARHSICLFNARKPRAEFVGHLIGHTERVVGVVFSKYDGQSNLCASVSEDLSVRVWDIKLLSELHRHNSHKDKPTAIDWSELGKDLIVTGDVKGTVLCWNFVDKKVKSFTPEHGHIFCLSCSPHNVAHVIVGYKSGVVLVINIGKRGGIVHKLRGHDDEVHSVVWCPVAGEEIKVNKQQTVENAVNETEKSNGCLVATSSRDRTVRLWNMSQGKAVMTLRLPSRVGGFRAKEKGEEDPRRSRVWLTLYWPKNTPGRLISSSHSGEMLFWDLCRPGKNKCDVFGQTDGIFHSRIVFNISFGGDIGAKMFITTSMDRQIIKWNMDTLQSEWNMPSLGGFLYCLDTSPHDPGRLAIGSGDNLIRIWNTSSLANQHDISTFWQGIKSKVTALSWHPKIEGWLAYGTDDGRVGIYGVFSNKPPRLSSTYHKRTVYRVCWGPVCSNNSISEEKQSFCLYSCAGEGVIFQHNPDKLDADAVNINHIISATNDVKNVIPQRTELSWKPEGDVVAIGNEDGSIEIFHAPNLLHLCNIFVQHKLINCLKWFPNLQSSDQSESLSDNQSDHRYWLASGSSEPMIHVYDLKDALNGDESQQGSKQISTSFCVLHGHTMKVTNLSWNPARDGKLASASYDGTVQVWDVLKKGDPVANFRGHSGRVLAVEWSVMDEDIVFSGGDDFTLMKWNVSKQQHTKPPKNKKEAQQMIYSRPRGKTKNKKEKKSTSSKIDVNIEDNQVSKLPSEMSFDELLEQRKKEILEEKAVKERAETDPVPETVKEMSDTVEEGSGKAPVIAGLEQLRDIDEEGDARVDVSRVLNNAGDAGRNVSEQVEVITCKLKKSEGKKRRKVKSLFPISASLDNRGKQSLQEDCIKIAEMKYGTGNSEMSAGSGDQTHLGLFGTRREAYAMFREEEKHHMESANLESYYCLELWKGNIGGVLKEATEKQQLTDHLVTMSTLGGHDVFLATAEAYANQLVHFEFYSKAATYYLACHKVYEAIEVLSQHKRLREAISLARVRLSPLDPVLKDLYTKWAKVLESEGNYEQAAKCCMQIGEPVSAVRLLSRKGDRQSLTTALKVATISREMDAASLLVSTFVFENLQSYSWKEAQSVIKNIDNVMHLQILLEVHEVLVSCLKDVNESMFSDMEITFTDLNIKSENVIDDLSSWPRYEIENKRCIPYIIDKYQAKIQKGIDVKSVYESLLQCRQSIGGTMSFSQVLIQVAIDLTLGHLTGSQDKASEHWLHAVTLCHDDGYYDMEKVLFCLTLNKEMLEVDLHDDSQTVTIRGSKLSLYGYYSILLLYNIWWDFSTAHQKSNLPFYFHHLLCEDIDDEGAGGESDLTLKDQKMDILVSKLGTISNVLLSEDHAELQKLRDSLKYIQQAVSNLLVKHREDVADPCGGTNKDQESQTANQTVECKLKGKLSTNQGTGLQDELSTNVCVKGKDVEVKKLPETWDCHPLYEKFKHPAVTLAILTKEKTKIMDVLVRIPEDSKNSSFPCPIESAMVLLYFLRQLLRIDLLHPDIHRLRLMTLVFGETYAITKQHEDFFREYEDIVPY
ncbi:gem-associated protein 5-like [Antedon mediterranea]|uniref:gem-associated protein 5-like n=1 Tax=Antedon mediterranea TaxID=105859 RepID=UPI003AF45B67